MHADRMPVSRNEIYRNYFAFLCYLNIVKSFILNKIKCFRSKSTKLKSLSNRIKNTRSSKNRKKNGSFIDECKWTCKKCTERFPTSRQLKKHRKEFHRTNIIVGKYNFWFNPQDGVYSCSNCCQKSTVESEMAQHVKTHDPHICLVCNDKFYSLYKFSVHNQTHEPGYFLCPKCEHQTTSKPALMTHINTTHLNRHPYNCNICGKGFLDALNFNEHQNGHAGAKAFSCVVCQKEFPFSRYLMAHQKRKHVVTIDGVLLPYQCELCKKVLSTALNLQKHNLQQHENAHHLCDICGKYFKSKDKLRLHSKMHTSIKPYKCGYCVKSFAKREYLIMHERIHSGEKPFACEYCGKAFNQRTSLKTHVRGHTGERPYVCHICKKGFISKNALNLHFKTCKG